MQADITAADRGEPVTRMEPLLIGSDCRHRPALTDLAFEFTQKSASFRSSLPPSLLISLANLVRAMNCYYSNLIEGHDTHPIDIERALKNDYSTDTHKRDLQLEAKAHIKVQEWIDGGGLKGGRAFKEEGICEIHRRFCDLLPEDLLWVEDPATKERVRVVPGELRQRDVQVGRLVAISPGALPRFLERFEKVYGSLGKTETIIGIFDWERQVKQTVLVDLHMSADVRKAAMTDKIADTLNYKRVGKRVLAFIEGSQFHLVETLTEHIAMIVLEEFERTWVRVELSKPGAIRNSRDVGVIVERTRDDLAGWRLHGATQDRS